MSLSYSNYFITKDNRVRSCGNNIVMVNYVKNLEGA